MNLGKFENFIFDLDGTIWKWTELIPGVRKAISTLEKSGKNILFITNNTALTINGYRKKLKRFGINAEIVINPTKVAINILKNKKVFCIGEGMKKDLETNGITLKKKGVDSVLIGDDRKLTFKKLEIACNLVYNGAEFYKPAKGGTWIVGNKRIPGSGAIASLIEVCTKKEAIIIGKPSKFMIDEIKKLKLNPKKTVVFGDECNSEIEMGNRLGYYTVLVLTGRDNINDVKKSPKICKPKMIMQSVADVVKWI